MNTVFKIKCPRHFILKPGWPPYEMERNPLLKNVSKSAIQQFKLREFLPKKDKYGNKIRDRRSWHQPTVSSTWAIEHVWDPRNPICKLGCKGRCMEGQGKILETTIRRLRG